MASSHHKPGGSHRSNRSSRYSESKSTNVGVFEPFYSEAKNFPSKLPPVVELIIGNGVSVSIYEKPLHADFIRPFTAVDVEAVLRRLPCETLIGLRRVNLLGGTSKQDRAAPSSGFWFGWYHAGGTISLHAFAARLTSGWMPRHPKPHVLNEFLRVGAELQASGSGRKLVFDKESLRRFYLSDVLVHEIGHHVDRNNLHKNSEASERYAVWFVTQYSDVALAALEPSGSHVAK